MIIKKAKYKKVKVWQSQLVSPELHGCDCCKKEINGYPKLDMTVWHKKDESDTRSYYFCSWECVFNFIKKVKCEDFISLPFLTFGRNNENAKEFINLIKKIK